MDGVLKLAGRAAILLLIWSLATVQLYRAVAGAIEHRRLSREVTALQAEYQGRLDEYTAVLAESERLRSDPEAQKQFLKGKFGYTERDETPIVVRVEP
jgi:cell division protein FtsB